MLETWLRTVQGRHLGCRFDWAGVRAVGACALRDGAEGLYDFHLDMGGGPVINPRPSS
jgi:hypothetical protein